MKKKLLTLFMWGFMIVPLMVQGQQLTYKTSWIGNTYPGGDSYSTDPAKAHIQNYIQNIWVNRDATDGKVFTTTSWDEGNREKSVIQNGVVIAVMPDPGHNVQRDAISGDANYVYLATVMHQCGAPNNGYGIRRFNFNGTIAVLSNGAGCDKSYISIHGSGTDLNQTATALAVNTSSKELYYADPVDNNVKVIDLNTNTVLTSFSISGISTGNNRLAVATDGYLWWLCRQDHKIYRYSNRGVKQSQEITGVQDPTTMCIDKNNNLYVADNGTSLQIKVYNNINSSPSLLKTIGDNGGIYSGNKGEVTDMKFQPGMAGLATDANGNIYLASNGVDNATGTILKSINASGTSLNWKVYGLAFVDNFDIDPSSDGLDVYGRTEHFKMDYSKSNGQEWSYKGYTVDKFTNTGDGARGDGTAIIRNRDGRKFMYTIGMYGGGFNLYRFDAAPSEIAVPVGSITRDGGYGWDVDNNLDVWSGGAGGKIRRYAYPSTNLNYNTASPEEWSIPAPFNAVERVKYIAESDIMYISGWSDSYPNSKGDWGRVGRIICRYNNWKGGNRTANATMVVNYDNQEAPKCMDIAGDYAFVVSCKTEMMWVYNNTTGGLVGTITPGPEINSKSGWVDIPFGTRAFKRSTGEYIILDEEDLFGKVVMYRWNPGCSASGVPTAPSSLTANVISSTQINLNWTDNSNNEDGFSIERKSGGGSFAPVGTNGSNNFSNSGLTAGTAYTYRIAAYNCKGNSGYSNEITATTQGGTIAVTGVTVTPTSASIAAGTTQQLAASVQPTNASNQNVSWSTSNSAVATVNTSGLVTAVATGTSTITVTTQDGSKTATCAVTVTAAGSAVKLTGTVITDVDPYGTGLGSNAFDANTTTFVDAKQTSGAYVGLNLGSSQSLGSVKFFPRSGQEARMNGGKFQGSADGVSYTDLYTISANPPAGWNTVTISGNYQYVRYINNAANTYCNVAEIEFWSSGSVSVAVTGVSVSPTTATVNTAATVTLSATVSPSNATNKTVSWSSGNTSLATVSASGVVTGVAAGAVTITVTTQDGNKTATCAVTVNTAPIAVTGVSLSPTTASIVAGATTTLTATVNPSNATNKTVSWSSNNTAIATVNTSGLVTGVAAGSVTITVTTQDGSKTATCAVTVTAAVGNPVKLTGTVITDVDPYGTGVGSNAFDGNTTTYVDAKQTSGAYVGLNLGSAQSLGSVKFFPRSGQEARMNGGKFQGSPDGVSYTDLYTISTNPAAGWSTVTITGSYQYVRYINNAANTYCNVAEIEFWSSGAASSCIDEQSTVTCYKAASTMNIDGNLNESSWCISNTLAKTSMGTKNNTVTFGVLYDNTNLYIGVKVLDGNFYANSTAYAWENDGVELYFDPYNSGGTSYDANDRQYVKAASTLAFWANAGGTTGAIVQWASISGGYTMEFKIPFTLLNISSTPANNTLIGFDIANDDDDTGSGRANQTIWNGDATDYTNPSKFGHIKISSTVKASESEITDLQDMTSTINVYPNPVTSNSLSICGLTAPSQVSVYDLMGKVVYSEKSTSDILTINNLNQSPGLYFISVSNNNQKKVIKLIVK